MQQVARYPLGAHVDVYVDPEKPEARVARAPGAEQYRRRQSPSPSFSALIAAGPDRALDRRPRALHRQRRAAVCVCAAGRDRSRSRSSASFPLSGRGGSPAPARDGRAYRAPSRHSSVIEELIEDDSDKDSIDQAKDPSLSCRSALRLPGERSAITSAHRPVSAGRRSTACANRPRPRQATTSRARPVTVYYDPDQPGTAVLEPDNRQGSARAAGLQRDFRRRRRESCWRSLSRSASTTNGPPKRARSKRRLQSMMDC